MKMCMCTHTYIYMNACIYMKSIKKVLIYYLNLFMPRVSVRLGGEVNNTDSFFAS